MSVHPTARTPEQTGTLQAAPPRRRRRITSSPTALLTLRPWITVSRQPNPEFPG